MASLSGVGEVFFDIFWGAVSLLYIAYILGGFQEENVPRKDDDFIAGTPKLALNKHLIIILIIIVFLAGFSISTVDKCKFIYNTDVVYKKSYQQKVDAKLGFYDKMWKTYFTKDKITTLNKETFIEVATLQMDARKDASQLAWKWVQENSPIPYGEFTAFYKDLSAYIESQREEYYALEVECQKIAMYNNMLLDTFPNNIYNRLLGREHITSTYGFLSDSTNTVFKKGLENIK